MHTYMHGMNVLHIVTVVAIVHAMNRLAAQRNNILDFTLGAA